MTTTQPPFILVRGVVYKLLDKSPFPISKPRPKYYRVSVPPDATPGKSSKWAYSYNTHRLPANEVIDETTAREVMDTAMARWRDVLNAARSDQAATESNLVKETP